MAALEQKIQTITRFVVPLTELIWGEECGYDTVTVPDRWQTMFKALRQAPGFNECVFGRVEENDEIALLVVEWATLAAFTNFKSTQEYNLYRSEVSQWSHPFEQVTERSLKLIARCGIFTCWFPAPVNDLLRERLGRLPVFEYTAVVDSRFRDANFPFRGRLTPVWITSGDQEPVQPCYLSLPTSRGHIDGNDGRPTFNSLYPPRDLTYIDKETGIERDIVSDLRKSIDAWFQTPNAGARYAGDTPRSFPQKGKYKTECPTETICWIGGWYTEEREKRYKDQTKKQRFDIRDQDTYRDRENRTNFPVTLIEDFDARLRELGCLGWREEHCSFKRLTF